MRATVQIDLNVRRPDGTTYAGVEDIRGTTSLGDEIEVYESESELVGKATVIGFDLPKWLIYLAVDWASLQPGLPSRITPEASPVVAETAQLTMPISYQVETRVRISEPSTSYPPHWEYRPLKTGNGGFEAANPADQLTALVA